MKRGSATANQPIVYVAYGSHASYPTKCSLPGKIGASCNQFDFRVGPGWLGDKRPVLPDGAHDGAVAWTANLPRNCARVACVQELPVDYRGRRRSWNAYRGVWGAKRCASVVLPIPFLEDPQACVLGEGPRTPADQGRYRDASGVHRSSDALLRG
jgi:hypothetical protein